MDTIINVVNIFLKMYGRKELEFFPSSNCYQYDEYEQEEWGVLGGLVIHISPFTNSLGQPSASVCVDYQDAGYDVSWSNPAPIEGYMDADMYTLLEAACVR